MRWPLELRPRRKLERLLGWPLPERPEDVPSAEAVAQRLLAARLDLRAIARKLRFDPRGYARHVLGRTRSCELVLACWLPGQGTPVHDHGGSAGATVVVGGTLAEHRFARRADGSLAPIGLRRVLEGEVMVERAETIHLVQNGGRAPAFSLHLYAPPIRRMRRFALVAPARTLAASDRAVAAYLASASPGAP